MRPPPRLLRRLVDAQVRAALVEVLLHPAGQLAALVAAREALQNCCSYAV